MLSWQGSECFSSAGSWNTAAGKKEPCFNSERKAETNGLFALGRYLFASLTIAMIIIGVSWFPVELNEFFFPLSFQLQDGHGVGFKKKQKNWCFL